MTATRRTITLLVAALAASMLLASSALAGSVTIKSPRGGGDIVVDLQQNASHFDVDAVYEIRSASGSARTERIRGISLAKLFEISGADPTYRGVSVLRPNGGNVFISKTQVTSSEPSPVIYESGGEVRFLRPSATDGDNNADDIVSSAGNLILQQTSDATLKISATASKNKVAARKLVTFSAKVSGVGSGEAYEISWIFDDGKKGTGEKVSHRYSKRGVYRVLATVKTDDATQSTVVTIQVGEPVKSKKDRTGGGTNDAAGAPDSGASDGASGSGENAATDTSPKKRKRSVEPDPTESLPTISGQVIDPISVVPLEQQSELAARSGSRTDEPAKRESGTAGIPDEALGIAGALGLLGLGFLIELGTFAGFRPSLNR